MTGDQVLLFLGLCVLLFSVGWWSLNRVERRLRLFDMQPPLTSFSTAPASSAEPIDLVQLLDVMRKTRPAGVTRVRASKFLATNKLYRMRLTGDLTEASSGSEDDELVGHSHETIAQLLRGVVWHEWPAGCATWTGDPFGAGGSGCRCDVEENRP